MATILETVDNPADAVAPCRVCIKELNSLLAVRNNFDVQLKKGIQAVRGLLSKDERGKIISCVCHVNRVMYDVTQVVGESEPFWMWPAVDTGDGKVDPLRGERITKLLCKQSVEHCCVSPWSFGQKGENENRLINPWGIATSSRGQFIVADLGDSKVKVFESSGNFMDSFSLPTDDVSQVIRRLFGVASDINDNLYVPVELYNPRAGRSKFVVYEFNVTGDLHHKFVFRESHWYGWLGLTANRRGILVVVGRSLGGNDVINVYDTNGQLVRSFGEGLLKEASDITASSDGRVMVMDAYERGEHLKTFKLEGCYSYPRIAFHQESEHIVIADVEIGNNRLHVQIYTKDGEFLRSTQIHYESVISSYLKGMTVTTEGHITVVCQVNQTEFKVLVV